MLKNFCTLILHIEMGAFAVPKRGSLVIMMLMLLFLLLCTLNTYTHSFTSIHYYIEGIVGSTLGGFHLIKLHSMYENFLHLFFMDLTAIYIHLAVHRD